MRWFLAFSLALLAITSMVAADPLYKWVDDQGNVHYSDKPEPGAKKIVLPKATTFTPPKSGQPAVSNSQAAEQPGNAGKPAIAIASPQDQETLWNVTSVTVTLSLNPALQADDTLIIAIDGKTMTVSAPSATFEDLERGEHIVTASITRDNGTLSAKPVTFYIQKAIKKTH